MEYTIQFSCWSVAGVLLLVHFGDALKCQVGYTTFNSLTSLSIGSSPSEKCEPSVRRPPSCFRIEVPTDSGMVTYFGCTNKRKCSSLTCETSKDTIRTAMGTKMHQLMTSMANCKIGCCSTKNCNSASVDSMKKKKIPLKKTTTSTKAIISTKSPVIIISNANASTETLKPNSTTLTTSLKTAAATTMKTAFQKAVRPTALVNTTANISVTIRQIPVRPTPSANNTRPLTITIPTLQTLEPQPPVTKTVVTTGPILLTHVSSEPVFLNRTDDGNSKQYVDEAEQTTFGVEISTTSASGSMYSFSMTILIEVSLILFVFVTR